MPPLIAVALVDDDALFREVLAGDLGDHGFAVQAFADAESCLSAAARGLPASLFLLDWSLSTMSGLELLAGLRASGVRAPIVFLTGHSADDYERAALAAGAAGFIDKACSTEQLADRLRRLLGSDVAR